LRYLFAEIPTDLADLFQDVLAFDVLLIHMRVLNNFPIVVSSGNSAHLRHLKLITQQKVAVSFYTKYVCSSLRAVGFSRGRHRGAPARHRKLKFPRVGRH
jgi:hypothetical protein